MKICSMNTRLFRVPPGVPWTDAALSVTFIELVILELITDTGVSGIGLSYTVGPGGSAIRALLQDDCPHFVLNQDPSNYREIGISLRRHFHRLGHGGINSFAIAAVDIALWDLISKSRGLPLYKVLGACRESVPAYESGIDLMMTPAELRESLEKQMASGAKAVKIKVGRANLSDDVERVAIARQTIGPDMFLLLDANLCWTLPEAKHRLHALEPFDPFWVEEPLHPEDVSGHAELRRSTSIPIAVGETLYTPQQFLNYLRAEAADIFQPDVVRVGGITEWMKIANLCEMWHRPVAPHYMSELSVHLLCAVPNGLLLENVRGGSLRELHCASDTVVQNGIGAPPTNPGHGIRLSLDDILRYEVISKV